MIYQHRSITCRRGKLQKRTELFKATALKNFEDAGSPLIGSFETITGDDAFGICWQYRQFDSIDQWIKQEQHVSGKPIGIATQKPVTELTKQIDEVDTYLISLNQRCQPINKTWPAFDKLNVASNVIFIQNIYWFQPSELETAIDAYFELILPTYRVAGVELIGLFGTILGSGSMNGRALRQVELIRFDDLNVWNTYRNILKNDARFQRESRERWLSKIDKVSSVIMEPTDFSRLR